MASFKSTLAEVRDADLLVHVVDASSPTGAGRGPSPRVSELGVEASHSSRPRTDIPGALDADGLQISAASGAGLAGLRETIVAAVALGARLPVYGVHGTETAS